MKKKWNKFLASKFVCFEEKKRPWQQIYVAWSGGIREKLNEHIILINAIEFP